MPIGYLARRRRAFGLVRLGQRRDPVHLGFPFPSLRDRREGRKKQGGQQDKNVFLARASCLRAAPHFAPSSFLLLLLLRCFPPPRAMSNSQRGTRSHRTLCPINWPTLTIQLRLRALPPLAGPRPPALVLLQLALLDLPFCSLLRPFILPFTYSSTFYPFSAIYPIREGSITRFHLRCPPPCRLCLPFCCSPLLAPLLLLTPSSPRATSPELGQ
jgi:hypothetical protein